MIKYGAGFKVNSGPDKKNIFPQLVVFDKKTSTFASQF